MNEPLKPLTARRLAWRNLAGRPFRAVGLSLVVAAFALAMFAGGMLGASVERGMESMGRRLGADLMLVPRGYDKSLESALLRGEPGTFYLKGGLAEKIRALPGVSAAASQLFLATLNASCCTWPIQLIAYEPETDFVVAPWIRANRPVTPGEDEVVVGHSIVGEAGESIMLFGEPFRIAARLDRTGMGFDTTVFLPMARARRLLRGTHGRTPEGFDPSSVSAVMVRVSPGMEVKDVANGILRRHAVEYDLDFVVARTMVSDIGRRLTGLTFFLRVLQGLLWGVAAGVLFLFFSVVAGERRREFALLRMLGATRSRLNAVVLWEAFSVGVVGALAGLVLGAGGVMPFQRLILSKLELPYLAPDAWTWWRLGWTSAATAVATGPLACVYTLFRNGFRDIYASMRSGE